MIPFCGLLGRSLARGPHFVLSTDYNMSSPISMLYREESVCQQQVAIYGKRSNFLNSVSVKKG